MVAHLAMVAYPLRAAVLRRSLYTELRGRPLALLVATLTVLAASAAGFLSEGLPRFLVETGQWHLVVPSAIFGVSLNLVAWLFWTAVAYGIGRFLLQGQGSLRDLLAATGLAYAPGLVQVLAFLTHPNYPVEFTLLMALKATAPTWIALAMVQAVRQTLRMGTVAAAIASIGWLGTAVMIIIGNLQQALRYGVFPPLPGAG
ncbi:MAG: YIP1 family protein [Chloroflexi bacterium]|nr:YIP1 family protein [Chloroflexota bacterium]